jgi:hypothetical protein
MAFSMFLIIFGLGAFCVLLFNCAVYALPFAIGLWAGLWAMNTGAGVGSVVIGFAAGMGVFLLGQLAFAWSRSQVLRWPLVFLFMASAAYAGYSMVLELGEFAVPSLVWRQVFAVIAAAAIGCTAAARVATLAPEGPARRRPATDQKRRRPTGLQQSLLVPQSQDRLPKGRGAQGLHSFDC